MGPVPKLLDGPAGFGDTDHRHVQGSALNHSLQGGENFLVCEVAAGAKQYEGIGLNAPRTRPAIDGFVRAKYCLHCLSLLAFPF